ncbi:MAG: hypothetical protein KAJ92_02440 [Gammaproteobacteria bacterium]|nr:hypothetical protein [Gammaproteobacteria bacterium]
MKKLQSVFSIFIFIMFVLTSNVFAGNADHPDDTHYTASGFFDIHVCNWPDRAPFYMTLYSTFKFNEIKSVELKNAKGDKFAALDLSKFMVVNSDNKPEKRVFINQIVRPDDHSDGWFSAKITLADGTVHVAKDFIKHGLLPIASKLHPAHREQLADLPGTLSWPAVKGASYYQIFIKDKWDEDKLIFSSKLLSEPKVTLPEDLLEYGGFYSWRVHARDINEDVKLGDFNLGSLNAWQEFTVAD